MTRVSGQSRVRRWSMTTRVRLVALSSIPTLSVLGVACSDPSVATFEREVATQQALGPSTFSVSYSGRGAVWERLELGPV